MKKQNLIAVIAIVLAVLMSQSVAIAGTDLKAPGDEEQSTLTLKEKVNQQFCKLIWCRSTEKDEEIMHNSLNDYLSRVVNGRRSNENLLKRRNPKLLPLEWRHPIAIPVEMRHPIAIPVEMRHPIAIPVEMRHPIAMPVK
jgi:hypothetical protein